MHLHDASGDDAWREEIVKFKEEEENAASDTRLSDAMDRTLSVTMESFTGGRREP